jgi:agmatine/peptidylarginine deiminase
LIFKSFYRIIAKKILGKIVAKRLQAEWEKQQALMVVFPTIQKDWQHSIDEIQFAYTKFITQVARFQKCIILCDERKKVEKFFSSFENLEFVEILTNDTWIRDFGGIDFYEDGLKKTYDFTFNAWGGKFESNLDNKVNHSLHVKGVLNSPLIKEEFILEGGSIDSNGDGVLLTTRYCLLNENRNASYTKEEVENRLKELFGLKQIIMLEHGGLSGDDTDSHIDTLARFLDEKTIAYVKCYDENDEHFVELEAMEAELKKTDFNLFPLPLPQAEYFQEQRLPATYLNFVFLNNALIVPTYEQKSDTEVLKKLQDFFHDREVVGVDSKVFIREHGSLHCSCMNIYDY